jgi:DNA-binding NarL/FixJ family response regulator
VFTVVVADDERVFAEALTCLLEVDERLHVLAAVSTAEDLDDVVREDVPDVAVVGTALATAAGSLTAPSWADDEGSTRVLVVAAETRLEEVTAALQAGVCGWVAKDATADELREAVLAVAAGDIHLPATLRTAVLRLLAGRDKSRSHREALASLTSRERDVLGCMVIGLNRAEMSRRLFLSPNTVRTHMQNVLRKLEVHSSLAAAAYARSHGFDGSDGTGGARVVDLRAPGRTGPLPADRAVRDGGRWISTMPGRG